MTYPDLFRRALALWWRTRALWPLGVLAALFGAGDYSAGGNVNVSTSFPADSFAETLPPGLIEAWVDNPLLQQFVANPLPYLIAVGAALGLLALIGTLIGQIFHGAMIRMADVADQGLEATIGDALGVGLARTLPLFLISLIVALPLLIALAAFVVVVFGLIAQLVVFFGAGADGPSGDLLVQLSGLLLCLVPLLLLAGVASVALGLFGRVAQRVCVVERLGAVGSLRRSWALVTRNLGHTLLTWLATLVLGALFGVVASLPAVALALPALFAFMRTGEIPWGALVGLVLYGALASVLLGGWLTSLNSALWTVLYRSFAAREAALAPGAPRV